MKRLIAGVLDRNGLMQKEKEPKKTDESEDSEESEDSGVISAPEPPKPVEAVIAEFEEWENPPPAPATCVGQWAAHLRPGTQYSEEWQLTIFRQLQTARGRYH